MYLVLKCTKGWYSETDSHIVAVSQLWNWSSADSSSTLLNLSTVSNFKPSSVLWSFYFPLDY